MPMSREFEEGQLAAMLGHEFACQYRKENKKADYKRGYQQGLKQRQEEAIQSDIRNMTEEQRIKCRTNIQRIKNLLNP